MADSRNLPYPAAPPGLALVHGVKPVTLQPPLYPAPPSWDLAQKVSLPSHKVAPVGQSGKSMVLMGSTPFGTSSMAILSQVRTRHNHIHSNRNRADKYFCTFTGGLLDCQAENEGYGNTNRLGEQEQV